MTLASLLLEHAPSDAPIRSWLHAARRVTLTAADLARIDSYGSSDGATLHAELALVLPLDAPVWYEAEVTAAGGSQMLLGYGATPAGPGEIAVWFAAHARGADRIVGPLGPLRLDSRSIDTTADAYSANVRELRSAAGIVIRALLLGLGAS